MVDLESKITLRAGLFISLIASLVIFVFSVLWVHQTDLTILKTNQIAVMQAIIELKTVPAKLAIIETKIENIDKHLIRGKGQ